MTAIYLRPTGDDHLCGRYKLRTMRAVAVRVDEGIGRTLVMVPADHPAARERNEPAITVAGAARRRMVLEKEAIG